MTERSIVYGSFTVERTYPVPAAKVFRAWSDPKLKFRWFGAPGEDNTPKEFDFRVGGREYNEGDIGNGQSYTFDVRYQDIVPDQRIVYTYEMTMGGERISVSLAAIELKPAGKGTRMVVTEYGAYLDGLDTNAQREEGTNSLIDQLGKFLLEDA
jgi:uncharacterized protein YndB with AHSA1/START domain